MPYPLEKGLFPLVVEGFFNQGLEAAAPSATPSTILGQRPGPMRRLRAIWRYCEIVEKLRNAKTNENSIRQVTKDNSFIHSSLFSGPPPLPAFQRVIAEDWFGMTPASGTGSGGGPGWRREPTTNWTTSKSLGHWSGYYGNVELILVETLQRMLEVSLGVEHVTAAPKTKQ